MKFLQTLRNIWSIEELRNKIILTLSLVAIYRIGSYVVLPGLDPSALSQLESKGGEGILGIFNLFAGGAFHRASVFALGIMPYISASIFVQLVSLAVPYFQKLQKEGESGRRKLNQFTRLLTILVTAFQATGYFKYLQTTASSAIVINQSLFWLITVVVLTSGTIFVMWLGEKITDKGLGNGTSILIMVGILARFPEAFYAEVLKRTSGGGGGLIMLLFEMAFLIAVIAACIMLIQGTRKVQVTYARRVVGNSQLGGVRQYLPLKVNMAGVMPIIFAQALMFVPALIGQFRPEWLQSGGLLTKFNNPNSFPYNLVYFSMILLFTYVYTALVINPVQMAEDMKKNNGFIAGVKPGTNTANFIDAIISRITLPGAIFLAIIAIMPAFAKGLGISDAFAQFFGGTSILIMVGVILDTLQQVETHLLNQHYDGLMQSGRIQGRTGGVESEKVGASTI
jgi:preprotein translocase subunit SecY